METNFKITDDNLLDAKNSLDKTKRSYLVMLFDHMGFEELYKGKDSHVELIVGSDGKTLIGAFYDLYQDNKLFRTACQFMVMGEGLSHEEILEKLKRENNEQ